MIRLARLLAAHVHRSFVQWTSSRGFVVTLVANQAVPPLVGLAVWSAALPGQSRISTYYVALLVVQLATVSYENHTLSNGIYEGALTDSLLVPVPGGLGTFAENLAIRAWHLVIGLPLILVAAAFSHVSLRWGDVAIAVPALALAAALRFLFTFALALAAFWTERAHSVVGFGETLIFLLGGGAAPLALFPDALRPWFDALPFQAMYAFPAELVAGSLDPGDVAAGYAKQALWLVAFAWLAAAVWRSGVRRFTAVGG